MKYVFSFLVIYISFVAAQYLDANEEFINEKTNLEKET